MLCVSSDVACADWLEEKRRTNGKASWHRGWPGRHATLHVNIVASVKKEKEISLNGNNGSKTKYMWKEK